MDKNCILLTNNPLLKDFNDDAIFVEGSFEEVLFKARDLTHIGYRLISHPLGASIRMLFSPYRSILMGKPLENFDDMHIMLIESSIESYKTATLHRKEDLSNNEDYAMIDKQLLLEALKEHEKMKI